jgi:hypothetical protein
MMPSREEFEQLFEAAFACDSSSRMQAMLLRAKHLWETGDLVSAYFLLEAYALGVEAYRAHAEGVLPGHADRVVEKFARLKMALHAVINEQAN